MPPCVSSLCKGSGAMWWTVGNRFSQRQHFDSTFILHLLRFRGVGRVSEPALIKNESWPAGRPCRIRSKHSSFPLAQWLPKTFSGLRAGWVYRSTSQLFVLGTTSYIGSLRYDGWWRLLRIWAFSRSCEGVLGMIWLLVKYSPPSVVWLVQISMDLGL